MRELWAAASSATGLRSSSRVFMRGDPGANEIQAPMKFDQHRADGCRMSPIFGSQIGNVSSINVTCRIPLLDARMTKPTTNVAIHGSQSVVHQVPDGAGRSPWPRRRTMRPLVFALTFCAIATSLHAQSVCGGSYGYWRLPWWVGPPSMPLFWANENGGSAILDVLADGSCPAPTVTADVDWIQLSGPTIKRGSGVNGWLTDVSATCNPYSTPREGKVTVSGSYPFMYLNPGPILTGALTFVVSQNPGPGYPGGYPCQPPAPPPPPPPPLPVAPTNLVARQSGTGGTQIKLTWDYGGGPVGGFHIYRKAPSDTQFPTTPLDTISNGGQYTYDDANLAAAYGTYSYQVKAFGAGGQSSPSNTSTAYQLRKRFASNDPVVRAWFSPEPAALTMRQAAAELGYDHFNWISVINHQPQCYLNGPDIERLHTVDSASGFPVEGPDAIAPFIDPPPGGYWEYLVRSPLLGDPMTFDFLPFYWNEEQVW